MLLTLEETDEDTLELTEDELLTLEGLELVLELTEDDELELEVELVGGNSHLPLRA